VQVERPSCPDPRKRVGSLETMRLLTAI
jgi:hypothetical protein